MFIFERRLAAVQHTGSSRERLTPRGQRRFPARARTPRGAAFFSAPSAIANRSPSSRRRPSRARLAGWAAANSTARCAAPEFMPNIEPMARGRHAEHEWLAPTGCIGHRAPICVRTGTDSTARQLPGESERCWVLLQFVHIYKATGQPRARARRHTAILRKKRGCVMQSVELTRIRQPLEVFS